MRAIFEVFRAAEHISTGLFPGTHTWHKTTLLLDLRVCGGEACNEQRTARTSKNEIQVWEKSGIIP
jgi:hypothetical protein